MEQADLGFYAGVGQNTISDIERGKTNLYDLTVNAKLAKALGVSSLYLYEGHDDLYGDSGTRQLDAILSDKQGKELDDLSIMLVRIYRILESKDAEDWDHIIQLFAGMAEQY